MGFPQREAREARCQWCGKLMTVPGNVAVKKWCSTRCKSARIPFFYPHLARYQEREPVMEARICAGCGVTFQAEVQMLRRRYCTPKCCKSEQDRRTYRRRVARQLERARA